MTATSRELERTSAASPTMAVSVDCVSRLYGSFVALREVSLRLPAGASVVLLGENGAGKSTLLKMIAGLAVPSYGSVQVFGQPPRMAAGRVATMGHQTMLYDELTGMENLVYFAGLQGLGVTRSDRDALAAAALTEVGLEPGLTRRVSEYSQGMRQRASLARVLMAQPDMLLLDEPFSNLDVASAHAMVGMLQRYLGNVSSNGLPRTLILTTHQAELARPLARTTVTMQAGRIAAVSGNGADDKAGDGATR